MQTSRLDMCTYSLSLCVSLFVVRKMFTAPAVCLGKSFFFVVLSYVQYSNVNVQESEWKDEKETVKE